MTDPLGTYVAEAMELGREAGRAAGSWAADGNTESSAIAGVPFEAACEAELRAFLPA